MTEMQRSVAGFWAGMGDRDATVRHWRFGLVWETELQPSVTAVSRCTVWPPFACSACSLTCSTLSLPDRAQITACVAVTPGGFMVSIPLAVIVYPASRTLCPGARVACVSC